MIEEYRSDKMRVKLFAGPGVLLLAAGGAVAQPTVDGRLAGDQGFYRTPRWVQNVPTGFGDNRPELQPPCSGVGDGVTIAINNSNVMGVTGGDASGAATATTGIELRIPLSALGNPTGPIKIAGFVNGQGHDFLSNQVIGGLSSGTGNLGEPRQVNFSDSMSGQAGDQFITVSPSGCQTDLGPLLDGDLGGDAAWGAALFTQAAATGFGDANSGAIDCTNGSEIDQAFGFICNADPDGPGGRPAEAFLFLFLTGNLESNFNKLDLFFDCQAGGQNRLRGDNPDVDFNGLNRMGDDGSGNGLRFDDGFEADYYLQFTCGNCPDNFATFASFAELLTNGGGRGSFIGSGGSGANALNGAVVCDPRVPSNEFAIGSEIDSVYSYVDAANRRLYVLITGNLENSAANKLNIFIDANGNPEGDEGQNTILESNVVISEAEGGGGALRRFATDGLSPGLTFDAGFYADYYMNFHYEATPVRNVLDCALLRTNGRVLDIFGGSDDYGSFAGVNVADNPIPFDGTNFTDFTGPSGIQFQDGFAANVYSAYPPRESFLTREAAVAMGMNDTPDQWNAFVPTYARPGLLIAAGNNSNIAGVSDTDVGCPSSATTGLEFSIDLDELGWAEGAPIRLAGFIASGDFTFVSNQVIGGLPAGSANLGEVRMVNFADIAGNQYVTLNSCRADWNGDQVVNSQDFFDFLNEFFMNAADFNSDCVTNSQDFFDFLNEFFSPCP
jgi:hypothetical protein